MPGSAGGGRSGGGHSGSFGGGSRSSGSSGGGYRGSSHSGSFGSGHSSHSGSVPRGYSGGSRNTGGTSGYRSSGGYRSVGRRRTGRSGSGGSGCLSGIGSAVLIPILIIIAVISVIYMVIGNVTDPDTAYETVQVREKLAADKCNAVKPCIETDLPDRVDTEALTVSMDHFYETTGVQPYFILKSDIDGDYDPDYDTVNQYLYRKYVSVFGKDEGHIIVLMLVDGNTYATWYIIGDDAVTVTDDSACEMLLDYIDYFAEESEDITDIISRAFISGADDLMYAEEAVSGTAGGFFPGLLLFLLPAAAALVIVWIVKGVKKSKTGVPAGQTGAPAGDGFGEFPQQVGQPSAATGTYSSPPRQDPPPQTPKPRRANYPVRCPYCGATAYPSDDGYCEYCGAKIVEDSQ